MILDTLNMFLGFVGIMLVLSLMVTALVQFIQSALMIRARNLRVGLESLVEKLEAERTSPPANEQRLQAENAGATGGGERPDAPNPSNKDAAARSPKIIADELIHDCRFVPKTENPESKKSKIAAKLKGPTCSWITKEELMERLVDEGLVSAESKGAQSTPRVLSGMGVTDENRVFAHFRRMEAYLDKRFVMYIRIITILCAIMVAGYFQVSTPDLLKRLHLDGRYRERAAKTSEELSGEAESLIKANTKYESISDLALEKLAAKHPGQRKTFERASGIGASRADIIEELDLVLEPLPASERSAIKKDYESLLDGLHKEAADASAKQMGYLTDKLTAYDITPWAHGLKYYGKLTNIVGVLMTAMFLSFGAPFWYERLRELIQLKDALKPKTETEPKK